MKSYLRTSESLNLGKNMFSIYFHFFFKLFAVMAIFPLPALLLKDLTNFAFPDQLFVQISAIILYFVLYYFGYFVVIGEISEIYLGSPISISKALSRVSTRGVGRLLGTEILSLIFIGLLFIVPVLVGVGFDFITGYEFFRVIGIIIGIILAVFLLINFIFVGQVVILERKYWVQAIKRSVTLVRLSLWKVGLYFLLSVMIFVILSILIQIVPCIFYRIFISGDGKYDLLLLGMDFYLSITGLIVSLLLPIFNTLFYYSLRIEKHDLTKEDLVEIKTFEAI